VRKSVQVQPGDAILLEIPETPHESVPVGFDLSVLYEDEYLAVIDKPAGLAVHGAPGDMGPSVAAWWLDRLGPAAAAFDVERPGIVHRLDKDTSGVLVLAKTPSAQAALSAAFEARTTRKTYLAICDGIPDRLKAIIDAPIDRHPGDRMRMAIASRGREARTEYEVIAKDNRRSLLLVHPETGRTHQIRVHLAAINTPVAHDKIYGKASAAQAESKIQSLQSKMRQLLHAYQLRVPHPAGGLLTITAPVPPDFDHAIRALGAESLAVLYTQPQPAVREEAAVAIQNPKSKIQN
jgi:23S rRNA pseudouridine1911/1915/1917 synthase